MAPDWLGRSVTPNDLWEMNRTLIVTYSHDPSSAFSDVLWSEVRHVWGNQQSSIGLKNFLGGLYFFEIQIIRLLLRMYVLSTNLQFFRIDEVKEIREISVGRHEPFDSDKVRRVFPAQLWNERIE